MKMNLLWQQLGIQYHELKSPRIDPQIFKNSPKYLNELSLCGLISGPSPQEKNEADLLKLLNQAIGIEVEVENCPAVEDGAGNPFCAGWDAVPDGSLRNSGIEFVTKYGVRVGTSFEHINDLFRKMENFKKKVVAPVFQFTERTSIHVHFDVRDMSMEELKSLLTLYVLFEDPLFKFAGEHRKHNVFCVPIRFIAMSEVAQGNLFHTIRNWKKYSALNLSRLLEMGTVEFRHMEGTSDTKRIKTWILLLASLVNYCRNIPNKRIEEEIKRLKYMSHYSEFTEKVFGPLAQKLTISPEEFDIAVSDSKFFFFLR